MQKNLYNTILENFLKNFLIPLYRGSMVSLKTRVIADINERSPFVCEYDENQNLLKFSTGESELLYKLTWSESERSNHKIYILKDINEVTV